MSEKERCLICGKKKLLRYLHPERKVRTCTECYRKLKWTEQCPMCGKVTILNRRHPETKEKICRNCYIKIAQFGKCSVCGKEKRIIFRHPHTKEKICEWCYEKVAYSKICSQCGKLDVTKYSHPLKKGEYLCVNCYEKFNKIKELLGIIDAQPTKLAGWLVDTALSRDRERINQLKILKEFFPERVREILEWVQKPVFPKASKIVREFLKTKEGQFLKS